MVIAAGEPAGSFPLLTCSSCKYSQWRPPYEALMQKLSQPGTVSNNHKAMSTNGPASPPPQASEKARTQKPPSAPAAKARPKPATAKAGTASRQAPNHEMPWLRGTTAVAYTSRHGAQPACATAMRAMPAVAPVAFNRLPSSCHFSAGSSRLPHGACRKGAAWSLWRASSAVS